MSDTPREPPVDARLVEKLQMLIAKCDRDGQDERRLETLSREEEAKAAHQMLALTFEWMKRQLEAAISHEAVAPRRLPCTCGPPSFPYQEHDGDCPRGLAEAVPLLEVLSKSVQKRLEAQKAEAVPSAPPLVSYMAADILDIVSRLRSWQTYWNDALADVLEEAAVTIEQLRARQDPVSARVQEAIDWLRGIRAPMMANAAEESLELEAHTLADRLAAVLSRAEDTP